MTAEPLTAPPLAGRLPSVPVGVVRVNLVPPEYARAARLRRLQLGIGAAVLASAAVVGLLYAQQLRAAGAAQQAFAAAQQDQTRLSSEQARLGNVDQLFAKVDAAEAMLGAASGGRINWSTYLGDLQLQTPDHVWLSSLQLSSAAAAGAKVGSVTISGTAYTHDDVAGWLERLAKLHAVDGAYLTSSVESQLGSGTKVPVVTWTTTGSITSGALAAPRTGRDPQ